MRLNNQPPLMFRLPFAAVWLVNGVWCKILLALAYITLVAWAGFRPSNPR